VPLTRAVNSASGNRALLTSHSPSILNSIKPSDGFVQRIVRLFVAKVIDYNYCDHRRNPVGLSAFPSVRTISKSYKQTRTKLSERVDV